MSMKIKEKGWEKKHVSFFIKRMTTKKKGTTMYYVHAVWTTIWKSIWLIPATQKMETRMNHISMLKLFILGT